MVQEKRKAKVEAFPNPKNSLPGEEWHADWPDKTGPINLRVHDLPHESSDIEWWYTNTHLRSITGREISLFASFFRIVVAYSQESGEFEYACAVTWAITDVETNEYHRFSKLPLESLAIFRSNLSKETDIDKRLVNCLMEVFKKDKLPLPDTFMDGEAKVASDQLLLDFGGDIFSKDDNDGSYTLKLKSNDDQRHTGCSLKFSPLKAPVRNRSNGVVNTGLRGDKMFYYFIPRNECSGTVTLNGQEFYVTGNAWYDHEFGGNIRIEKGMKDCDMSKNYNWDWTSIQLEDGRDITSCVIKSPSQPAEDRKIDSYIIIVEKDGTRTEISNTTFTPIPGETWWSAETFVEYPTAWFLRHDNLIDLQLNAGHLQDQEFPTFLAFPSFWEGRVKCTGTINGVPVNGLGYIECHGRGRNVVRDMKKMFKAPARAMHNHIEKNMPLESDEAGEKISDEAMNRLVGVHGSRAIKSFPQDLGREALIKNILEPLRDTYDRGGKAWRSMTFLVCLAVVGGDSKKYSYLSPVPEYIHSGSLIIDDIQDKSLMRRGKPCCHIIYGESCAINAGTFSYFAGPGLYKDLPDDKRLKLFDLFFSTMLAGHVGQGADIAGLDEIMERAVETGDSDYVTQFITGIHRLKSGLPVRHMAESGCIIGDASPEQVKALGDFFEAVGIAFQIVDDAVNLEGFTDENWKTCGEDIMEGKVTFPVGLALKHLDLPTRQKIWKDLKAKPKDKKTVQSIIEKVRETGALDECRKLANDMVKTGWNKASPLLKESYSKIIMHASALQLLDSLTLSTPLALSEDNDDCF